MTKLCFSFFSCFFLVRTDVLYCTTARDLTAFFAAKKKQKLNCSRSCYMKMNLAHFPEQYVYESRIKIRLSANNLGFKRIQVMIMRYLHCKPQKSMICNLICFRWLQKNYLEADNCVIIHKILP